MIEDKIAEIKTQHQVFKQYLNDVCADKHQADLLGGYYMKVMSLFEKIYNEKHKDNPLWKQASHDTYNYLCNIQVLQDDAREFIISHYL